MLKSRTASRSIVGLDIQPGYVAAAETSADSGMSVLRAATDPLPPGLVRDGEVADVDALASALRDFFRRHKLSKRVRMGVANQRIVVRTIHLPPIESESELAAAVHFQAQEHIPMPLEHAVLEFRSLGVVETPEGPRTRVLLVAARRDMVQRLHAAACGAGLKPEGIDLSAFAMVRALASPTAAEGGSATLYLSVGGVTNLAIAEGARCLLTRVVPGGTETIAAELCERRGLTLEHAHSWLTHVGLTTPVEAVDGDPQIVADARMVLTEGAKRIGDGVRSSLDFYRMNDPALVVDRAVLTGSAAAIPGFREELSRHIALELADGVLREASAGALGGTHPGRVAVAAGLSLQERLA